MRSVERNEGQISNKLAKEFPMLKDPEISDPIEDVINAYVANRPVRQNYDPNAEVEALQSKTGTGTPETDRGVRKDRGRI
jgi:hypothetical protein